MTGQPICISLSSTPQIGHRKRGDRATVGRRTLLQMPWLDQRIGPKLLFMEKSVKARMDNLSPEERPKGCEYCLLNGVSGIRKIIGTVEGKDIFVWAQSPGWDENRENRELVGRCGKFLWKELKQVGITRERCDIQNVVRCLPADQVESVRRPLKMRDPNKEERRCCSLYTIQAIEKQKAKLHLVFGKIAQKELLDTEYKKDKKVFWSEKLNGYVVCLAHPGYFVRGCGGDKVRKLGEFRELLEDGIRRSSDVRDEAQRDTC
jgi:uracil-DNA glycosylase family 4